MYQIMDLKDMELHGAALLFQREYEESRRSRNVPAMTPEMEADVEAGLRQIRENAYGAALLEDGKLAGFLGFLGAIEGFHGDVRGAFSPLGASAFAGKDRARTASLLVQETAERMVKDGIFQFAISRPCGDEETGRALCLNGMGIRCSDAVLELAQYKKTDAEKALPIRELRGQERQKIAPLYEQLDAHMRKSPCFFPKPQGMVQSFLAREDVSILAAFWKDTAVGYMAVDEEGETFVTLREDMLNICGAYVSREFRSAGVAKQLLDAAVSMAQERGKTYLGVDYETVNPTALHFWTKYFTPYTYSYIRRIDERVVTG